MVDLLCGSQCLRVDESLARMAQGRVFSERFLVASPASPALTVERVTGLSGQLLESPMGRAVVQLEADTLRVEVGEGPFLGELVLRLAWYVVATRQGGVLVHSAGIRLGESALVACGKSGDGKSTLSRLSRGAGLELMSDEILLLVPDGRVAGTPFRSDADNPGSPGFTPAKYLVALQKEPREALSPLSPRDAAALVSSQCFHADAFAIPRAESHRRLLGFLSKVELRTLSFRKHPEAGRFVARLLEPEVAASV